MRLACLFFGICIFFAAFSASASEKFQLPCEVMEASDLSEVSFDKLDEVQYALIRHANSADRAALSKWLQDHGGVEVTFRINDGMYRGVLCRLGNCFGRGLLIYSGDVRLKKRDIVEVTLPLEF